MCISQVLCAGAVRAMGTAGRSEARGTPLGSKFPLASYSLGMVFSSYVGEGSGKDISNLE